MDIVSYSKIEELETKISELQQEILNSEANGNVPIFATAGSNIVPYSRIGITEEGKVVDYNTAIVDNIVNDNLPSTYYDGSYSNCKTRRYKNDTMIRIFKNDDVANTVKIEVIRVNDLCETEILGSADITVSDDPIRIGGITIDYENGYLVFFVDADSDTASAFWSAIKISDTYEITQIGEESDSVDAQSNTGYQYPSVMVNGIGLVFSRNSASTWVFEVNETDNIFNVTTINAGNTLADYNYFINSMNEYNGSYYCYGSYNDSIVKVTLNPDDYTTPTIEVFNTTDSTQSYYSCMANTIIGDYIVSIYRTEYTDLTIETFHIPSLADDYTPRLQTFILDNKDLYNKDSSSAASCAVICTKDRSIKDSTLSFLYTEKEGLDNNKYYYLFRCTIDNDTGDINIDKVHNLKGKFDYVPYRYNPILMFKDNTNTILKMDYVPVSSTIHPYDRCEQVVFDESIITSTVIDGFVIDDYSPDDKVQIFSEEPSYQATETTVVGEKVNNTYITTDNKNLVRIKQ